MSSAVSTAVGELQLPLSAGASQLNLQLEPAQLQRLVSYVMLLQRWNRTHNLSAVNDSATLLQHVVDCLAVAPPLTARLGEQSVRALDAGTGAGLPAVVLAIAKPDWTWTAVDAVGKKVAFVRQVAGELDIRNLRPVHGRLEQIAGAASGNNLIVCRAFSTLRQLVEQTRHLLRPDGWWAAMKGRLPDAELRELPPDCQLFHVEPVTVPALDAARSLVWLKPVSSKVSE